MAAAASSSSRDGSSAAELAAQAAHDADAPTPQSAEYLALDAMIRRLIAEKDPKRRDDALLRRLVAEKAQMLANQTSGPKEML